MNELCQKIAEILDEDNITPNSILKDIESWDSLSALSVISMIDAKYSITLTSRELAEITTVTDLWNYIQANSNHSK